VSYNVHRCVGLDGRRDPARIAEVLRETGGDVLCLQEVDARPGGGHDSVQMDFLASALEMTAIAGPTIIHHEGTYGNALLTRRPVLAVRHVDLTYYRREPRGAIDAELDVGGTVLRVVATHLGLLPRERRWQVRRLMAALGTPRGDAVALCGDMNEWFAVGRPLRWLHATLGRCATVRTFPARWPLFALDRIWVYPRADELATRAHTSSLARVASDHLPCVAEIAIPRGANAAPAAANLSEDGPY
jgi:endonuclease/exonuclease/phosphatase family metal-dependent hydrolase